MAEPDAVDGCSLKWTRDDVDDDGPLLGYLARASGRRPCGSERSPWRVTARPGQRLRFTVMDFSSTGDQLDDDDDDVNHGSDDAVQSPKTPRPDNDGTFIAFMKFLSLHAD